MSFKDHFSRLAAQYSAFRPTYPEALFDYLAGLRAMRESVWDCACGSGQASVALAGRFHSVVATDASASQIQSATPHPNVVYRVAPAENSGLDAASVDLVTVAQALHWLDLDAFYKEVRRVLRAEGVIAVWTYGGLHVEGEELDKLTRDFYCNIVGPYWPPERRLVEDGYRQLAFPFEELTPPAFAMHVQWNRPQLLGYMRTWSATARYVDKTGLDPVVELEERLDPLWKDSDSLRRVTWPLSLRVGRMAARGV